MATDDVAQTFKDYPPAEVTMLSSSIVTIVLRPDPPPDPMKGAHPDNDPCETLIMSGRIKVLRGKSETLPDGRTVIPQEILEADGIGYSKLADGLINLYQHPTKRSLGMTVQSKPGINFPAQSWFNIFFEIKFPNNKDLPIVENEKEIDIATATIIAIPPVDHTFQHYYEQTPVALSTASGERVGWIIEGKKATYQLLEQRSATSILTLEDVTTNEFARSFLELET